MRPEMEKTLRAIRRAAGMRGFLAHLLLFIGLLCLMLPYSLERQLFWPLVGWTIGLIFHGLAAIGPGQIIGSAWEEERLEQLAAELRTE